MNDEGSVLEDSMLTTTRPETPADMEQRVAYWRTDTPGCAHRIHMNNAGAGLMPRPVVQAIQQHIELEATIGGYEAAAHMETAISAVYDSVAALINAEHRNIALVSSATAAFVQALSSFDLKPGDVIITTRNDYTSYQIQLLALAQRVGVTVLHAADRPEGGVDPDSVRELIRRSGCRLVTVSWIPTHSGLVQDVAAVGEVCEEFDVPYHVDACQAVGQLPVDVTRLRCDYLSGTARKFLRGPRGMGFLFASDRALARGDYPLFVDMRGATWVAPDRYEVHPTARRFEEWEFPYALVLGLGGAADYAMAVGAKMAHERSAMLAASLGGLLREIPGVHLLDAGPTQSALVFIEIAGRHASEVAKALYERCVNSSVTLQWYGLRDLGERNVQSALRLSPHYYNTEAEVLEVAGHLRAVLRGERVASTPR